ncbi:MAG: FG-GAP-like repeat-containing protein [Xanthomonadales bacterium]|nr:FG-GAP-like repeat-containing protein [Xanthomonadales bacterium]
MNKYVFKYGRLIGARIAIAFMCVMVTLPAQAASFTLGDPAPFHLSPGDHFRIPISGGMFSGVGDVEVRFTPLGGGAPTNQVPEDIVTNMSVGVRVPTGLAVGQYTVKVIISSVENDPADANIWVRERPFQFVIKPSQYAPFPIDNDYKDADFGDVNNDGFLDIFEANSETNENIDSLLINQLGRTPGAADCPNDFCDQTVSQFENTVTGLAANRRTYDADLVDLDLDGDLDLVRIDGHDTQVPVRIFINDGSGNFTDRTITRAGIGSALLPPLTDILDTLGGGNVAEVDSGDVNGDGKPDLILCHWSGSGKNVLLLNQLSTSGGFEIANSACGGGGEDAFCQIAANTNRGCAFGHFNNDTLLDIILPTRESTASDIVLINNGNNGSGIPQFTVRTDWVTGPAPGFGSPQNAQAGDLKVADLDGDGDADVVIGSPWTTEGRILWNDNNTRLVELAADRYPVPVRGYDATIADLDRDGDMDIIYARYGGQNAVLINRGGADANLQYELADIGDTWSETPNFQLSVSAGDYDLDGDLDLVTGGFAEVRLWESNLFDQPGEERDWVFVLDRTRSMISGGRDFFEPAKNVLKTFLAQRRAGDQAGLVTYDYTGTDNNNPNAADDVNKAQVESQVGDRTIAQLQNDVEALSIGSCTGQCTAIGWAIKTGKEVAQMAPDHEREKVMVLLTDGRQNQSPHPDTIIPSIPSNILLYTIALGSNTDDRMLSALATNGGKFYFAGRSSDYASVQSALREIDNDLEAHATGKQPLLPIQSLRWAKGLNATLAKSPMLAQNRLGNNDLLVGVDNNSSYFIVDPADSQVRFTLSWRNSDDSARMILVDPKGRTHPIAGDELHRERRGDKSHVIEVLDPLSGVWRVQQQISPNSGPAKLTAMASSELRLSVKPEYPLIYVGEPLVLIATLPGAVAGMRAQVRIISPSKVETVITGSVIDDNQIYFNYPEMTEPGSYNVEVVVVGPSNRPFIRTWQSAIYVAQPTPNEVDLRTAELSLDQTELLADGSASATASVQLKRRDGAPLSGAKVSFLAQGARMSGVVTDHGDGSYSQTLVAGKRSGEGWLMVRVGLTRLSDQVKFSLLAGVVDSDKSSFDLLVGPTQLCSNQRGRSAVQVMPIDSNGNAILGATVTIEKISGSNLQWDGPVIESGRFYQRTFWGPGKAGAYTFSAKVNGVELGKTVVLQVFDPDSPEGQKLACVAVEGPGGEDHHPPVIDKEHPWYWYLLLIVLLLLLVIWWLYRRRSSHHIPHA